MEPEQRKRWQARIVQLTSLFLEDRRKGNGLKGDEFIAELDLLVLDSVEREQARIRVAVEGLRKQYQDRSIEEGSIIGETTWQEAIDDFLDLLTPGDMEGTRG